ncbi:MAG: hypothetical protein RLZZ387_4006 [Chloroflexota bacterium]|jgi:hypothetical protein
MAESETILRLGIEAAREGNREEARNLFSLLTRQEPDNVQAWLWLAGVAEGPEQRRAALEQVLVYEPDNEMALKGLQAMGVTPPTLREEETAVAATSVGGVASPPAPSRAMTDEEMYAAELDSAFDLADELPRAAPPPRRETDFDEAAVAGAAAAYNDDRPRGRPATRVRTRVDIDDDDDMAPARRGPSPLLWALLAVIILALLGFLLWQLFFSGQGDDGSAVPTTDPNATVVAETPADLTPLPGTDPGAPTIDPALPTADPNAPIPTVDPAAPTADLNAPIPTADPNAPPPTADPNAGAQPTADPNAGAQPTAPPPTLVPVAGANPLIIPANAFISANGWNYSYPGTNVCAFGCAVVLGNQAGGFTASGTFVHILAFVQNTTGTAQPLPADFFVLRDAQGRIHEARVDVAGAVWQPGASDVSHASAIPANNATTSVYLVFDVPTDATNLVLFSRYFIDQGWQVLESAQ